MSKVRNVSGGELDVPLLGRSVAADEVVEVPDFQPAHNPDSQPGDPDHLPIVWPPDKWEPVTVKAGKADTGKAPAADAKALLAVTAVTDDTWKAPAAGKADG